MFIPRFNRRLVGGSIILVSCACLAAAPLWYLHFNRIVANSLQARGRVVKMIQRNERFGEVYYPVVTFRDARGYQHTFDSNQGSTPPSFQIGDTVTICYRADAPDQAMIEDPFLFWGVPFVIGALGGVYLPIGLMVWFWPRILAGINARK
jgi:Protein of unknown function (DUF3592)